MIKALHGIEVLATIALGIAFLILLISVAEMLIKQNKTK